MARLRVQEVRRAVSRPAIKWCIEVWRKVGERLACDLHGLWGDRVLRAGNPDGKDHYFNLKQGRPIMSGLLKTSLPSWREAAVANGFGILCIQGPEGERVAGFSGTFWIAPSAVQIVQQFSQ